MWKIVIFSLVENNKSMSFSLLVLDYFGFLHCFTNSDRCRFGYLNSSNFSVLEQKYEVLVCIFVFRMYGTFWLQDYFHLPKLFVFVSPALRMIKNTERRRHDVHILFGDVVMTSEAHIGC